MYKYTIHIVVSFLIILLIIVQVFIYKKVNDNQSSNNQPSNKQPNNQSSNEPKQISKYPINYSTKVLSVPAIMNFKSNKSTYDPRFDGTIPVTPDDYLFYNSSSGEGAFSTLVDGTYTFNFSTDNEIINEQGQNTFTPNDRTYMYLVSYADNESPLIMKSIYVYKKKSWSIENVRLFAGTVYRITICYDSAPFTKIHCKDLKVQVNVVIPTNLLTCDIKERKVDINPEWCNVIVSDPWEIHPSPTLTARLGPVFTRISKFIDMMRSRGSTIIFCVSDRFAYGQEDNFKEKSARNNLLKIKPTPFQTKYKNQYYTNLGPEAYITLAEIDLLHDEKVVPRPVNINNNFKKFPYVSYNTSPLLNIDPNRDYLGDGDNETAYRIYTLSENKRLVYVGVHLDQCLLTSRPYSCAKFTGLFPNLIFLDLSDYSGTLDPALVPSVSNKGIYSRKDVFEYLYRRFNKDHIVQPGIYDETTFGD